ncbi:hypothetical protein [Actinomadura sp. B10D3]|uniref:hypothetical protein n=1 Tax=Actinomadura sp. B10D3 TaxID=3153557 RepID=UPI00325F5677
MPKPHMIIAPEPETAGAEAKGAWLRLSAAFTEEITDLADRDDLTVTCAPGAGHGAPGCFIPALATVELDGKHLGHHPTTCDPSRPADRDRYPALWGVLVHEAAHASHTRWTVPDGATGAHVEAALALEESRIEAAHLRRRPADRRWLRASASRLVLADFTAPSEIPGGADAVTATMTPWDAARAAALLLARVDAGILDPAEVADLKTTITGILSPSRLSALAALWHIAHVTGDDDRETMLDLGRRWCNILDTAPDRPAPKGEGPSASSGSPEPSPLASAITSALTAVATAHGTSGPGESEAARQRAEERAVRERAARTARRVFGKSHPDTGRRGPTAITGSRPATADEQAAARRLARVLRAAAHRERTASTTTSATPPGRLKMRGALAADAQRAAGLTPTAEPFTRTTRRHVPSPPLRMGIACDVSGSMHTLAGPVASAAWIMARAAAHVPDAQSATVIFGARVRAVTHPGQVPQKVRTFSASDSTEQFTEAVDALAAALDLTRAGTARLLVVVSDGIFTPQQREAGEERIRRLDSAGCAVLWLALDYAVPLDGARLVKLSDPTEAATAIGRAATRALSRA